MGDELRLLDVPGGSGDRVAVRIVLRLPQRGRHALDELVRHGVLEPLGLGVHAAPVVSQMLRQVHLQDAVAADHLQRGAPPLRGELHAAIWHVLDQPGLGEPLHHPAHRRRGDVEQRGDVARGREATLTREVVDGLQVVLDRPSKGWVGVA